MDIHYAQYLASELYGVEMSEDKFEEIALIAYRQIGNKRCKLYRFFAPVDCATLSIDLPCNVAHIEAVTGAFEDWKFVTNKDWNGDWDSSLIEEYIERTKLFTDPLYMSGKYVKYEQVGDKLYFDKPYGLIGILYKGEVLDDDGLPDVNDKEALAIATYVAYTQKYKEGIRTMNPEIRRIAMELQGEWRIKCDQAKTPEYINQNEMDEILDAKNSWNRKWYHRSLKPII